jgi:hypothetical protein
MKISFHPAFDIKEYNLTLYKENGVEEIMPSENL